jgi:sugar lactone lactonase YvrE
MIPSVTKRRKPMRFTCRLDARDIVGESIVWDERAAALWWVDIVGRRIHRYAPSADRHDIWSTPDFPTSIGLRSDGGFVVGLTRDVCFWSPSEGFARLATPEPDLPDNRLNEGRAAPDGSFWVGSMQNNLTPDGLPRDITRSSGAIYRIGVDGSVRQLTPREFGIANTMLWMEGQRFVTADTLINTLYEYRIDTTTGLLSDRRVFAHGPDRGLPDGSCLDADGRVWNCRVVEGAALARFSSRGALEQLFDLPCAWPTSCTFGGPNLRTLYVTSAQFTMSPERLQAYPQEGGLFASEATVTGRLENRVIV